MLSIQLLQSTISSENATARQILMESINTYNIIAKSHLQSKFHGDLDCLLMCLITLPHFLWLSKMT